MFLFQVTVDLATTTRLYDNTKHTGCDGGDCCGWRAWAAFYGMRLSLGNSESLFAVLLCTIYVYIKAMLQIYMPLYFVPRVVADVALSHVGVDCLDIWTLFDGREERVKVFSGGLRV